MTGGEASILWIRRLLATTIDFILVPVCALLIMLVTGALEHAEDYAGGYQVPVRILVLGVSSYLSLNGWLLYRRGETVGKSLLGIKIVSAHSGTRPALWKLLCLRAPFFPLLYLVIFYGFTPWLVLVPLLDLIFMLGKQRRCLHDYAAGTFVVAK
jgi:uncharacterized RDD family membrane protein YckC